MNNDDFEGDYSENATYFLARLTPVEKKMQKHIQQIEIYFLKEDYHVSKLKILEISGDYTNIEFQNRQSNSNIDDKIFILN